MRHLEFINDVTVTSRYRPKVTLRGIRIQPGEAVDKTAEVPEGPDIKY